ncbi:MAG: prolyl aminopeptidase [Candidatus Endonucleobacter bathymodioli]|uniref:Proline iminopeptidase n=1 Tax=Candidatus Endonucleibacter bathymodioli TaxID=539814 RepID=A0AA90NYJ7_9GAMM|nr:prolyl aminopeptidase [Candidatus Endonucleobacter bathymodioli]
MHTLYPAIKPYQTHRLKVGSIHEIYIEECGSPDGIPILFVHGGPGLGCSEKDRCFFDPERYRIILFDQRGCGRSKPYAVLEDNTIADHVTDMESIRVLLKINRWMLFGGSWGSTLALLYGQTHPAAVISMILRGVFLSREQDFNWLYKDGANRVFPDKWQEFIEFIPENEREYLIEAYHQRLFGNDEIARMNAAKHWATWKGGITTLRPSQEVMDHFCDAHHAVAIARIGCHYFKNKVWLGKKPLLSSMNIIAQIPSIIIHGRYDMISPLDNATILASHWPEADLQIIRDAGHASIEPSITDALILATDKFAREFNFFEGS